MYEPLRDRMNTPALSEWLVVRPVTNLVQLRENPNANGSLSGSYIILIILFLQKLPQTHC